MEQFRHFVARVLYTAGIVAVCIIAVFWISGWVSSIPWLLLGVLLGMFNFYAHAHSVYSFGKTAGLENEQGDMQRTSLKAGLIFVGRFTVVVLVLILIQLHAGLAVLPTGLGFALSYIVLFVLGYRQARWNCNVELE